MTIKEARRLSIGDVVVYGDSVEGIVIDIKADSALIQWKKGPALNVPHNQMTNIQKRSKQ